MAVTWTDDQQSVLDVRNKNVLVSAAAGSGKTAVLVERIIRMVCQDNVDIDRLLVVTFTNSAAGEMRERILKALEKKSKEEPLNDHLQKQLSYIHNALITTIDSFCLNIVRQYFNEIDVDPSFTVGDDGELKLIKEDVMKELLESYYQEGNEEFLEFVGDYSSNRSDEKIEELIKKLYEFSMSYPYPEKWLDENIKHYEIQGEDNEDINTSLKNQEWYRYISEEIDGILSYSLKETERAINIALSEDGPFTYEEALRSDMEFLKRVIEAKDYDKRVELLGSFKAAALSRKKLPETTDDKKKDQIKAIRDGVKKEIKLLKNKYYGFSMKTIIKDIRKCGTHVRVLVSLTKDFIRLFEEAKREKNIIDFNDMEHMALKILTYEDNEGNIKPTETAMEISEEIDEIMTDEYQDSNLVQETILNAVSKINRGRNNIFMVGDVKQSIYKFRLARPELFLEKYERFPADDDHKDRRISLSKNFRSRKEVLDGANLIFSQIMSRNLGGIEYDKDNALYNGADYEDYGCDNSVELLLADTKNMDKGNEEVENRELEAYMVAQRIKEMIGSGYKVKDKITGKSRNIRYSDIAILLRSFGAYGEAYGDILQANGIPVKSPAGTGYFDTFEIVTILNMLSVIDNPRQDIPLVSVMKNMYLFTDEELAVIKSEVKLTKADESCGCFWDYVCAYAAGSESEGTKKAGSFIGDIENYREIVPYTSIHDIIEDILKTTGFGYFTAAMKAGSLRMANIEMLKEKAVDFENTSYSGLFNFVRYIENLKKYNVEQGEADMSGGGDYVTLMTIHKSKGLEFPVVFVGAMCKQFNKMDTRGDIVMHHDLGIGLNYLDRKSGIKANTLIKESIGRRIEKENIAEELRVFYVAVTRAKEKLILAGNGNVYGKLNKYIDIKNQPDTAISPVTVFKSADYLEWVLMSIVRHKSFAGILKDMRENVPFAGELFEHPAMFTIKICTPEMLMYTGVEEQIKSDNEKSVYEHWNTEHIYDKTIRDNIKKLYEYKYPYEKDMELKGKVSVSDIKHMFMKMYDEDTLTDMETEEVKGFENDEKPVPAFISENEEMTGARRGTVYHRIFELIDYGRFAGLEADKDKSDEIKSQLKTLKEKEAAPKEYFQTVSIKKIAGFINSHTGKRMIQAAANGVLYREKQFVIGIRADNVKPEYSHDERVLVQGIVDAYFEEDGEIVIVDYKTDNIRNIKDLFARYESQLNYYAMALEQITGKRVKEKILYSVKLDKEYTY